MLQEIFVCVVRYKIPSVHHFTYQLSKAAYLERIYYILHEVCLNKQGQYIQHRMIEPGFGSVSREDYFKIILHNQSII